MEKTHEIIRRLIKEREYTPSQFAERADMSLAVLSRLTRFDQDLKMSTVLKVCYALDVTPNEIFGYEVKS